MSTAESAPKPQLPTVQTFWDADRLDLGRIGIKPKARYLCTSAAKEPGIIEWAFHRSQQTT